MFAFAFLFLFFVLFLFLFFEVMQKISVFALPSKKMNEESHLAVADSGIPHRVGHQDIAEFVN